MKPDELKRAGIRLYGRKGWRIKLAEALALNPSTVWRMESRGSIPGPVEVAVRGLLQNKRANDLIRKLAKETEPRLEKKPAKAKAKKRAYTRKVTVDSVTKALVRQHEVTALPLDKPNS